MPTEKEIKERLHFLENCRKINTVKKKSKSKLITLKIEPELLKAFKYKCEQQNIGYTTMIKKLIRAFLDS